MKKFILSIIMCTTCIMAANAQRFALIDMEYIMKNIPAYQQAINELDQASQQYQKAIDAKRKEAETLYKAYQQGASSMSRHLGEKRGKERGLFVLGKLVPQIQRTDNVESEIRAR